MNTRENIIARLVHIDSVVDSTDKLSNKDKAYFSRKIKRALKEMPEGSCGSPEVVLSLHIMNDLYLDTVKALMGAPSVA